jgi:hypothetical protein
LQHKSLKNKVKSENWKVKSIKIGGKKPMIAKYRLQFRTFFASKANRVRAEH